MWRIKYTAYFDNGKLLDNWYAQIAVRIVTLWFFNTAMKNMFLLLYFISTHKCILRYYSILFLKTIIVLGLKSHVSGKYRSTVDSKVNIEVQQSSVGYKINDMVKYKISQL